MARHPSRNARPHALFWACLTLLLIGAIASVTMHKQLRPQNAFATIVLFPGFTADELSPPDQGLVVTSLQSDSEAQREGLAVGDEVLAIDDHLVRSLWDAQKFLDRSDKGDVSLHVLHNRIPRDVVLQRREIQRHGA